MSQKSGITMSIHGIVSNIKARIAPAKPYLIGGVIGAFAVTLFAFNAGWVISAGAHTNAVQKSRLEAVATVCAMQASEHWAAEGNETASLKGWSNDARDQLAERFTPQLENVRASEITELCARKLRPA